MTYLEHANMTVPNIDAAIEFLLTLDPDFQVRKDATPKGERRWAHVGSEKFYIAINEPTPGRQPAGPTIPYVDSGVNHLGWVVQDFEGTVARLRAAGFQEGYQAEKHPHRSRAYFLDKSGFEWEIIGYHSDRIDERNDYML